LSKAQDGRQKGAAMGDRRRYDGRLAALIGARQRVNLSARMGMMIQPAHSTLPSESLAVHKAIFDMGGEPLRFVFEILAVPWLWCWFALEVRRAEVTGLADIRLPVQPGDFDMLLGRLRQDGNPDFAWIAGVEIKRLVVRPNDDMRGGSYGTTQARHLKNFSFDRALLLHLTRDMR
jgi:hypothetical protein